MTDNITATLTGTNALDSLIESLGIKYTAQFVPQSQSRNNGNKDASLNWKVTINGLTTDYMQGIGHIPNLVWSCDKTGWKAAYHNQVAETGKYITQLPKMSNGNVDWYKCIKGNRTSILYSAEKPLPIPELKDVLYCLVMDSEVLNYGSFEDWASEFGYDKDSKKAEKIYTDCISIALKLRNTLGEKAIAELREAFQDY